MRQFLGQHPNAAVFQVDAGGLFNSRIREPQNERIMWRAVQEIGVDILNLSPRDAAVLARLEKGGQAGPARPQLVSANVFNADRKPIAPAYLVKRAADGTRLIFIGVSESRPGGRFGYVVDDPRQALARLLPTVETEGAVVVLLAYMPARDARELAQKIPAVSIVVSGHEDEFAVPAYRSGEAWVFQAQYEGRFVGCANLKLQAAKVADFDAATAMIVTLDPSIPDDPRVAALLAERRPADGKTK